MVRNVMDPQLAIEKIITRRDLLEIFGIEGL